MRRYSILFIDDEELMRESFQKLVDWNAYQFDIAGIFKNGESAWEYLENSPLRDLMCRIFEEQYGRKPIVEALHAGVECGIFAGKIPELDCVSFGPDMKDIHTPKESMDVESVKRTWEYLLEILKQLK